MRRWLMACLAAIAVVASVAFTAPANAAPAHRACASGECYAWTYYGGNGNPTGFKTKWTTNVHSWFIRGHSKCVFPGVPAKIVNGGWVHNTGIYSAATCPSPYVINQGAEQWKKTESGSITTHWETPV